MRGKRVEDFFKNLLLLLFLIEGLGIESKTCACWACTLPLGYTLPQRTLGEMITGEKN